MKNVVGNLTYDRPRTSSKRDLGILLDVSNKMGVAVLRRTRILSHGWMWLVILPCCFAVCKLLGGIPVMDMDLIQMERRNNLGCHILENPNKMAAAGKQSTH